MAVRLRCSIALANACHVPYPSFVYAPTLVEAVKATGQVATPIVPGVNFPLSLVGVLFTAVAIAVSLVRPLRAVCVPAL